MLTALVLTWAPAGVLLWAGLEKLRARADFAATLGALGFTGLTQRVLTLAVPVSELMVAAGLLLTPSETWPRIGVGALGVAFAAAGVVSLRRPEPVACSCFGAVGGGTLGLRQVAALPLWLATSYTLHQLAPDWSVERGIRYLAVLLVALGALRVLPLLAEWKAAVGNRRAGEESFGHRRPIVMPTSEMPTSEVESA